MAFMHQTAHGVEVHAVLLTQGSRVQGVAESAVWQAGCGKGVHRGSASLLDYHLRLD